VHEGPCLHGYDYRCQLPGDKNILEPFHWYQHRDLKEGGCISGAAIVPNNLGWPSEYNILYADFIFFEIYNMIEDADSDCRSCRPPTSGYRNETFYRVPKVDGINRGGITDIFFGPYNDTQALYVISRDGTEQVMRIRYTDDVDNTPPVPKIKLKDLDYNYTVGETFEFDGSSSSDADGDDLDYAWDFDDGTTSTNRKPAHVFEESGKYVVILMVTDTAGLAQQSSMVITIGKPPTVTISSPLEGDEFYVGQIFQLIGEAFDFQGNRLDDSKLTWEVRKHHADHYHPFLDPTDGNDVILFPAPEPEDFFASTNSYLQVILKATDSDGLTTEVDRLIQPWKINVDIESVPPGIEVSVDLYPLLTNDQIVSWKDHKLNIHAKDQPPYQFQSWWDGNTQRERKITLSDTKPTVLAIYCAQDYWICMSDEECCSGSCVSMACMSESIDEEPGQVDDETDNEPESELDDDENKVDIMSGEDHPINEYINDILEGNEKDIKEGFDADDEKNIQEDVENHLEDTGESNEVNSQEISNLNDEEGVEEEGVEEDGGKDAEEVTEVNAKEVPKADMIQANAQIEENKDNSENAGLGTTGIVFIVMSCLIILFVVLLEGCLRKKRTRKKTPATITRGYVDELPETGDFHSSHEDEENRPSDIPDTNINLAANTTAVKLGSSLGSDQDVLNNTYETSSSSSF
jgi:PKD repeat protein